MLNNIFENKLPNVNAVPPLVSLSSKLAFERKSALTTFKFPLADAFRITIRHVMLKIFPTVMMIVKTTLFIICIIYQQSLSFGY